MVCCAESRAMNDPNGICFTEIQLILVDVSFHMTSFCYIDIYIFGCPHVSHCTICP